MGPPSKGAKGTFHSLTVQSVDAETAASPFGVMEMPRTAEVCPMSLRRHLFAAMSHNLMSPSAEPERREFNLLGFRARQVTPSSWDMAAKNGFANTLSNLAAVSALVYSTALSKGCKEGSRFRWTF